MPADLHNPAIPAAMPILTVALLMEQAGWSPVIAPAGMLFRVLMVAAVGTMLENHLLPAVTCTHGGNPYDYASNSTK